MPQSIARTEHGPLVGWNPLEPVRTIDASYICIHCQSPSCCHNRFLAWKTVFRDGADIIWRQTTLFLSWYYHPAVRHLAFICPGHHCLNPGLDLFPLKLFLYLPSWLPSPLLINTYFTLLLAASIKIYICVCICVYYTHIYIYYLVILWENTITWNDHNPLLQPLLPFPQPQNMRSFTRHTTGSCSCFALRVEHSTPWPSILTCVIPPRKPPPHLLWQKWCSCSLGITCLCLCLYFDLPRNKTQGLFFYFIF